MCLRTLCHANQFLLVCSLALCLAVCDSSRWCLDLFLADVQFICARPSTPIQSHPNTRSPEHPSKNPAFPPPRIHAPCMLDILGKLVELSRFSVFRYFRFASLFFVVEQCMRTLHKSALVCGSSLTKTRLAGTTIWVSACMHARCSWWLDTFISCRWACLGCLVLGWLVDWLAGLDTFLVEHRVTVPRRWERATLKPRFYIGRHDYWLVVNLFCSSESSLVIHFGWRADFVPRLFWIVNVNSQFGFFPVPSRVRAPVPLLCGAPEPSETWTVVNLNCVPVRPELLWSCACRPLERHCLGPNNSHYR